MTSGEHILSTKFSHPNRRELGTSFAYSAIVCIVCSAKTLVLNTNTVFPERENANSVIQALSQGEAFLHTHEACEGPGWSLRGHYALSVKKSHYFSSLTC